MLTTYVDTIPTPLAREWMQDQVRLQEAVAAVICHLAFYIYHLLSLLLLPRVVYSCLKASPGSFFESASGISFAAAIAG